MNKMHDYPYVNTRHQMQPTQEGLAQQKRTAEDTADDHNLNVHKKYNVGGYMQVPQQPNIPQEGNYSPQQMSNAVMLEDPNAQQMANGGYMQQMRQYNTGGVNLPGGAMKPIPNSDAVEFVGASHDDGGIMLDSQTEVEGGETMDQVNMARKGGKRDYFFSDHLKKDGMSYADHHKHILRNGGDQQQINMLAKMQESAAGRDPNQVQVAAFGGIKKFEEGGTYEWRGETYTKEELDRQLALGKEWGGISKEEYSNVVSGKGGYPLINGKPMNQRQKDFHDQSIERGMIFQDGAYFKNEEAAKTARESKKGMQVSDGTNPYVKGTDEHEMFEQQKKTAEADGLVYIVNPNKAGSGKWVKKEDANTEIKTANKEQKKEDKALQNQNNKSSNEIKRENKYKVASYEKYGDLEGEFGDIPDYQPGYMVDGIQMYAGKGDTPFREALKKEDFRGEWMNNVDPEVLEAAGITSFSDMNDPANVTKYQEAWNEKNPDNQIAVDGKFGEQTFRTAIGPPEDETPPDEEETTTEETTETTTVEDELLKKKADWITPLVGAAQLIPSIYAFNDKPDYMSDHEMMTPGAIIPERIAKTHLERIDMNPEKARNAADFANLNRFVDTSGGGPSNMMNKMAAYAKKQQGDREIAAQEQRANVAIANQEAVMDQQRKTQNVMNTLDASKTNLMHQMDAEKWNKAMDAKVDEFNRGADAATKDRRLNALDTAVKTIAGMNQDRLQYNAQERLAQAISGNTGVYSREQYAQTLVDAGYDPTSDAYKNMMNTYIKKNQGTTSDNTSETSSSSTTTTTTKKTVKFDAQGNPIEENVEEKRKGGFSKPVGFRRRYS